MGPDLAVSLFRSPTHCAPGNHSIVSIVFNLREVMASNKTKSRRSHACEQLVTSDDDSHSTTFEVTPDIMENPKEDCQETPAIQPSSDHEFLSSEDVNSDEEPQGRGRRSPRKGTKMTKCVFSDELEAELGEWYRKHPILYNKGLREFKNADQKFALYESKARSLDPPMTGKICFVIFTIHACVVGTFS